ncbi:MAG: hypothetical protein ABL879_18040, partial [Devosia sp.]
MTERTISLPGFHPLRFFSKLRQSEERIVFFTSGPWTIVVWNPTKMIRGDDAAVFAELKKLPVVKSALPFAGGAIGYCPYDVGLKMQGVASRHHAALPEAVFHVYDHAVLWDGKDVTVVGSEDFVRDVERIHLRPFSGSPLPAIEWKSALAKTEYRK